MMEMRSNISDESENDVPLQSPDNGSHIRTGGRVVHARPTTPVNNKRSSLQRRRHQHDIESDHLTAYTSTRNNRNLYTNASIRSRKYTRKFGRREVCRDGNPFKALLFIILPLLTCLVGFFSMLSSLEKKSTPGHLIYNHSHITSDGPRDSKSRSHAELSNNADEKKEMKPDERIRNKSSKKTSVGQKNHHDETKLIARNPKFDAAKYVKNYEDADQNSQYHPHSIQLKGWNNPIAFRTFPYARNILGPIKNVDPDYGLIAYESLRNQSGFARVIPLGEVGFNSPGAFDPASIEPLSPLKKRHDRKKGDSSSYLSRDKPFDPKAQNVQRGELRQYFDDDNVRITREKGEGESRRNMACRAASWEYDYYPTCNSFHEIDVSRPYDDPDLLTKPRPENSMLKVAYLNHGFYRDVYLVEDNPWLWPTEYKFENERRPAEKLGVIDEEGAADRITKAYRSAVLKTFNWEREMDSDNREMVNIEAVVMERLTKSPRIINIYGHCAYSVSTEVVPIEFEEVVIHDEGYASIEQVEIRNKEGLRPYNNFTAEEKLGFALSMAESLADLHGFEDGVIVHDDVQLCQWLRLPDGTMKLGDFNRATIMEYDVINEGYCKFNNGEAFGNYRAPEEFAAKDLDEKIDVFSFGNNIYAMMTGLWGFYDLDDDESTQDALIDGKLPYIDPRWSERSYIERRLVELMVKCWEYDPDHRIDIFYAVAFLKDTIAENNKLKGLDKK